MSISTHASRDAGYAYQSYVRLKLIAAHDFVARTRVRLSGSTPHSLPAQAIGHIVDAWVLKSRNRYAEPDGLVLGQEETTAQPPGAWARILLAFDVEYR